MVKILDAGTSVLINLGGVQDQEARRLIGCLLTISYEQAALSREGTGRPRTPHHLIVDEMGEFVAQSEHGLARMLSQTRKQGLFAVLAHQTYSQTTAHLRGALQNCHVEIAFGVGREDAEAMARAIGRVDTLAIKSEAKTDYTQPIFMELAGQWEEWIQHLVDLPARNALVKVKGKSASQIVTPTVPTPRIDPDVVDHIKQVYRDRLTRPQSQIALRQQASTTTASLTRTVHLRPQEQHPQPVFSSSTPVAREESLRQPGAPRNCGGD